MTTPIQDTNKAELAMFTIAFSIQSDEQAIEIKKNIEKVLEGIEDVRFDFRIMTTPPKRMWPS